MRQFKQLLVNVTVAEFDCYRFDQCLSDLTVISEVEILAVGLLERLR